MQLKEKKLDARGAYWEINEAEEANAAM